MQNIESQSYKICQDAIALKNQIEKGFLVLGKYLYEIKAGKLYDPAWSSWEEFCMEFPNLSSSSISRLINIYSRFVLEYAVSEDTLVQAGGWSVIAEILPVKDKERALGLIEGSRGMTRTDIRRMIKEDRSGVDMMTCEHEHTHSLRVCDDCGERVKEYSDESA